jgi:hypothetical protein
MPHISKQIQSLLYDMCQTVSRHTYRQRLTTRVDIEQNWINEPSAIRRQPRLPPQTLPHCSHTTLSKSGTEETFVA